MSLGGARPPFSAQCNAPGCRERLALTSRTFEAAREEVLSHGWIERCRKGGARRSEWSCPTHGRPLPNGDVVTSADTTHGYRPRK